MATTKKQANSKALATTKRAVAAPEWRAIAGFPSYEVSSDGHVRRAIAFKQYPAGYELRPRLNVDGYRVLRLGRAGALIDQRIARLVALAFVGPQPSPQHEVAHWDGVRTNDRLGNLRWATREQNAADKARHGTNVGVEAGSSHGQAKLSEVQVLTIRAKCSRGEWRASDAAHHFGVSRPTITGIIQGRTWAHIL